MTKYSCTFAVWKYNILDFNLSIFTFQNNIISAFIGNPFALFLYIQYKQTQNMYFVCKCEYKDK